MNQTISTNIYKNWIYSFSKNDFIKELLFTILFVSQVLFVFPKVLQYCEGMEGAIISDWVLNSLEPRDFSQVIFLVEYSAVFLACLYLLRVPLQFVRGLQAYALLLILRM
ncbi:MAG TPA: hypothetical protein PKD85_20690, partial [Saprospiraceae bacterium]|nr:hypothetical protein [Saprospiraceae bacterium]